MLGGGGLCKIMNYNLNVGYGRMIASQLAAFGKFALGKIMVVCYSSNAIYDTISQMLVPDPDGNVRLFTTIQGALNMCVDGDVVLVTNKDMVAGDTDPSSYAETLIIAAGQSNLVLMGISNNRTQGGLPQIKKGSGTTALLTVRAPGCLIANLGFNGIWTADSTQSLVGILLDDDASTKTAFGTTIENCHFKNCAGATASANAAAGGAITWAATGGAWQVRIKNCRFYKNVGDIVLLGTSGSVPQDVIIEDNIFSGPAANTDCQLYLAGGSGMNGVIIRNNVFSAFPAIGSGTNLLFMNLTGCVGVLANNYFGANAKTYKAAGTGALVPTTVFIAGNYQEVTSAGGTSSGEFGRAS